MYIYIYYMCMYWYTYSANKRSCRVPDGVGRGLDSRSWPKTCAPAELAFVASRGSPVASPLPKFKFWSRHRQIMIFCYLPIHL